MNTKTDGISSVLVAVAWLAPSNYEWPSHFFSMTEIRNGEPLVRLSDAEAIINDLQTLVIAENQRKQQLEEEVMWLKAAQPNIALIANKDATTAKQAAFIEEQKGTITALNIALGGEDSTSTENLVDAYEHDPESVGLCFKYRAAKDKILMQTERIKELETLHENEAFNAKYFKGHYEALWEGFNKQSDALKLAREALTDWLTTDLDEQQCWEALAAIDDALGE